MNGTEQRARHTAVTRLSSDMDRFAGEVETLLGNFARELQAGIVMMNTKVGDERSARLKLAQEQRGYVDNEDRLIRERLQRFESRGFWSRLNWLLTGR